MGAGISENPHWNCLECLLDNRSTYPLTPRLTLTEPWPLAPCQNHEHDYEHDENMLKSDGSTQQKIYFSATPHEQIWSILHAKLL